MSETDLVRASRDGDQFHYLWAARRCLRLLSPDATLKAVTIEGASKSETDKVEPVVAGEELIDVGEYYGSESLEQATLIRYIQLKHSTVRVDDAFVPSEMEKMITGFAKRYKKLQELLGEVCLNNKLEFWFISNRPINTEFFKTIQDIAEGNPLQQHDVNLKKLERFTGFSGTELAEFCKLLQLQGNQEGLWDQRNLLAQDFKYYLVDTDMDAPMQLKELVTKKALSESADNPSITKMDVLRALKTDIDHLFPAVCLISNLENVIPREQESDLFQAIVQANDTPVIVHAAGGVGKSIFATRIKLGLPEGSTSILYDCFGNARYRNVSSYRHRHRDALVQIANELAAKGLCHPLIPSNQADSSAYIKAFLYRLKQSIDSLKSKNSQALLCIIIDAADNAQMAAEEIGEARSFVRDLIREKMPEGVRLVFLCRTHRQQYLEPPPNTLVRELHPFSRSETAKHLHQTFNNASEQDVDEFHYLSSQNPRVQALALSREGSLSEILRTLGPNPTTVEDTIGNLLESAVIKLRDAVGTIEKNQIDKICAGLAVLRPLIPLSVLSSIAEVDEAAIRSFALDLGRPLLVLGDTIQFIDEPAETWFRDKFEPNQDDLARFIANMKPLAVDSSYVASALPQLMLRANQLTELVELALSSQALPHTTPIEKRDVELQRLQFALKASLRAKRYSDAAKLALKAGGESAGGERQRKLLQENTDLAAVFLEIGGIQELVSRKTFGSGWVGSHNAYEAALMSGRQELLGDARSRLRMANEWLNNWSRLLPEERKKEEVSDNDILEMASAMFNIHGADACARDLRRWNPREISFRVGRLLARRFVDHGRYRELDELALAAGNNLYLILAIVLELRVVHRMPPKRAVERAYRLLLSSHIKQRDNSHLSDLEGITIQTITKFVETAYKLSIGTEEKMISLLTRYLPASPPRSLSLRFDRERFHLLRAYFLRAGFCNQSLSLIDLAHDELKKELENPKSHSESQDAREFKQNIGVLCSWYQLWVASFLKRILPENVVGAIAEVKTSYERAEYMSYRQDLEIPNEIARIWMDTLWITNRTDDAAIDELNQWVTKRSPTLYTTTLIHCTRLIARTNNLETYAIDYALKTFRQIQDIREEAETKSDSYIAVSRAIFTVSPAEAAAYFNQAVEFASKIGDENLDRWRALLDLSSRAAVQTRPNSVAAYRLARCAELSYEYVVRDKYFDWDGTVEAIAGLCGMSAFAILSRWRERDFGRAERILPVVVKFLVTRGDLNSKAALALTCFHAEWDKLFLLKAALDGCMNKVEKESVAEFTYRYMSLEKQSANQWRNFKTILSEHGISLFDIDDRIVFSEHEELLGKTKENNYDISSYEERESKRDWDAIFEGIDLRSANEVFLAYGRFKASEAPYHCEYFFDEAYRRVQVGNEAALITAISESVIFDLYDLRIFFKQIPERWKIQLSVKQAIAHTLRTFCRRFCMEITKSRRYEMLSLSNSCELAGVSESQVVDVVFDAIGKTTEIIGVDRLFTLIGLLVLKLSENEALDVLSFGLDLFDTVLEDNDGDGPWSSRLAPPSEIEGAVAGYIWSCLADPKTSLRWEAAHIVFAVCKLGQRTVLRSLLELAQGTPTNAFSDASLYFYELHARQWLLIGLARGAKEYPNVIAPYADFLTKLTSPEESHILIREYAKRTLLALIDAGLLGSSEELRQRLSTVNVSTFTPVEIESYRHFEDEEESNNDDESESEDDKNRIYFDMDMLPYWFAPLGRCFGLSPKKIEREVLRVIRDDWQLSGDIGWSQDERHKRKIFKEMETHHSHGSYPSVENLFFYCSYHAMMVVAGKLLATIPVRYEPAECLDEFGNWLKRHVLSRQDGGWLADCRDPVPLEWPMWKDETETDEWRWSITKKDFDRVLFATHGRLNLRGHWNWFLGHREESIRVYSALVSPKRSMALLRALQSVDNPYDFQIPDIEDEEDELEIDFEGFQLKGWIFDCSNESEIDKRDPWSASIEYPSYEPANYIVNLMKLDTDSEHRIWFTSDNHTDVIYSQVWGEFQEKDEGVNYERGNRLQASVEFVVSLLSKLKMDLIVEIQIERRLRYSRWERSNTDDNTFIPPSARLFLVKADGNIYTL